jgi:chromate transporter
MTQIFVIIFAGLVGYWFLSKPNQREQKTIRVSYTPAILFSVLLFGLPFIAFSIPFLSIFNDFFQAGSLVFGGGHVVLPLLQNLLGNQIEQGTFLTGYAAAQAVPGPMFTLATYLGYFLYPPAPILGALLATIGVFLPGFLLLMTVMSHWKALAQRPKVAGVLTGVNAAVVGLLVAAFYQPVFVNAIFTSLDMAGILIGVLLWQTLKLPILWLVAFFVLFGVLTGQLTGTLL